MASFFCKGFVDTGIPPTLLDSTMIVHEVADYTSSKYIVIFDADEIIISFEGGSQLLLAWRQVG